MRLATLRQALRELTGTRERWMPVRVLAGDQSPRLTGRRGGFYTKGGRPIDHPSAYSKVGWSNMTYRRATLKAEVGLGWLAQHKPELYAAVMAARLRGDIEVHNA